MNLQHSKIRFEEDQRLKWLKRLDELRLAIQLATHFTDRCFYPTLVGRVSVGGVMKELSSDDQHIKQMIDILSVLELLK